MMENVKLDKPERYILAFNEQQHGFDYATEKWYVWAGEGPDLEYGRDDDYYLHHDGVIRQGTANGKLPSDPLKRTAAVIRAVYTGFFDTEEEALEAIEKYYADASVVRIDEGDMMIIEGTATDIQNISNSPEMALYRLDSLYPSGQLIGVYKNPEYAAVFWKK